MADLPESAESTCDKEGTPPAPQISNLQDGTASSLASSGSTLATSSNPQPEDLGNYGPITRLFLETKIVPPGIPSCLAERLFEVSKCERNSFWEGRALLTCNLAAGAYVVLNVLMIAVFGWFNVTPKEMKGGWSGIAVMVSSLFVTAGPPAFFWIEAKAFDKWCNDKFKGDVEAQKGWRETYKLNADNGKAFWAAMVAAYAAAVLINSR